jgi:transcriptional regulator with XRE-family HTH domain
MNGETDILRQFGLRVRELRKAMGFSQEAFAAHCGLDRTYVGGIERGERNVALRNIAVIAKALGITVSELLQGLNNRG